MTMPFDRLGVFSPNASRLRHFKVIFCLEMATGGHF